MWSAYGESLWVSGESESAEPGSGQAKGVGDNVLQAPSGEPVRQISGKGFRIQMGSRTGILALYSLWLWQVPVKCLPFWAQVGPLRDAQPSATSICNTDPSIA